MQIVGQNVVGTNKFATCVAGKKESFRTEENQNMNVKPLGDKLLVQRAEPQKKTDSGIYLPESAKDKPREGTIIAVGNGHLNHDTGDRIPFTVKKGDHVLFTSYAGTDIKIDNEEYLIMTEDDILGIIE
jgi:chaperonin GroES